MSERYSNRRSGRNHPSQPSRGGDLRGSSSKFDYIEPIQAERLEVVVYGNNFDKAFKLFRSFVQKEGILGEYKERQSFEKPSDKARRKRKESGRREFEMSRKQSAGPVVRRQKDEPTK